MAGEPSNPSASSAKNSDKPKKSFDNVIENVKRAFSRRKKSTSSKAGKPVGEGQETIPETPTLPKETKETKEEPETVALPVRRAAQRPSPGPPPPALTPAARAEALFKKHGLEISPSTWKLSDKPRAERVHKEIRMRVHRSCHKCNTTYGPDKTCLSCGHKRCKQCPRFPQKKDKGKEKVGEKREVKPVRRKKDPAAGLTLASRTGGQDLVRKPIRQRVHRTCHRCDTDFGPGKICSKCHHNRCKKCPRDPFKKSKPPGYYDGRDDSDSEPEHCRPKRTYRKPRMRVRWTCSKCSATFKGTKICDSCGSNRADTGIRDPPKKSKNPNAAIPSESYMAHLEDRLLATTIS